MQKLLVVCLGVLLSSPSMSLGAVPPETFVLADRVGELNERCFFMFATSAGGYIVRQDGMGEFTSPKSIRRVFLLKLGPKARIDRVYYLEHEGDLFLLYEWHDASTQSSYLVRMEQTRRKPRWITVISSADAPAPVMRGDLVVVNGIEIRKIDGQVRQD
jgi:hypothetical protein